LPPNELIELVAATATYNMVARFLVALDIHPRALAHGAAVAAARRARADVA